MCCEYIYTSTIQRSSNVRACSYILNFSLGFPFAVFGAVFCCFLLFSAVFCCFLLFSAGFLRDFTKPAAQPAAQLFAFSASHSTQGPGAFSLFARLLWAPFGSQASLRMQDFILRSLVCLRR